MAEDLQKRYDERVERFLVTANMNEPDRVPILSQVQTWAISQAGYKFEDLLENYELEAQIYTKANDGYYYDGCFIAGINHLVNIGIELGSHTFFISPNAVTLQHKESSSMKEDEYDEFIADPMRFFADKIAVRKVKAFQQDDEEAVYKDLERLFDKAAQIRQLALVGPAFRERIGLPIVTSVSIAHPMDNFFDFVRGFIPTMTDMRRRPEKVAAALNAITPFYERSIPSSPVAPFPWTVDTHHIATFLTKELFERFYWPFYQKTVEGCFNAGTKMVSYFEGPWVQHYDLLDDLPKASIVAAVDPQDIEGFKKRFGGKQAFFGGLPMSMVKYNSVAECIEQAKKVLDIAAPGGGYIFSFEQGLLSPNDVNADTLREVNRYVAENAVY
ncbi:MAG: hypothetical protein FWG10_07485 [Eubacteriaceae bacterium]|nr:hypothetical protein [Eubacteriaceae bacterium]